MDEDRCEQCGTPAAPGAKYCESCGALLQGAPPAYQPPPSVGLAAGMLYEGVAIRFVAFLIDTIILAIISGVVIAPFSVPTSFSVTNTTGVPMVSSTPNPFAWVGGIISAIIWFFYFVLLEGRYGQTVGKMAVKIKVLREDGSMIDYADAVVRTVLRLIDLIPYFIPYLLGAILIWSSDKKQRLGDRAAHTIVVKA